MKDRDITGLVRIAKASGGGLDIRQMQLVSVEDDMMVCKSFGPDGPGMESIQVAKPYLLRRNPFDSDGRNNITYTYSSPVKRTARTGNTNTGFVTELQAITPPYVLGDILFAIRGVIGGTGVTGVGWIDLNLDGRAWARTATQP